MSGGSDHTASKATSLSCCGVAEGKREIKGMMDDFLRNLHRIIGNTFVDENSFFEPFDNFRRNEIPSPLPPLSLDASLHIPGTFMRPRPETPSMVEDELNIEKNQSPPHLEPYQTLHPGIWCDFCGKQIKGLRFKCQECPHYDLCANCIVVRRALDKHNEDKSMIHRFSTISAPNVEESSVSTTPMPIVPQVTNASPKEENTNYVVYCDRCDARILHHYDLCETCIGFVHEHDNMHRFLAIHSSTVVNFHSTPAMVSPASISENPVPTVHHALCDLCGSRITGDRFKCVNCPDFDTCLSCFSITSEQHPGHTFVKIREQEDLVVRTKSSPVYHFATCDVCRKHIVGVRYKCMHPDCPDFDLCQTCEALPFNQHPDTHPMLKLKHGNTYIPPVPRKEQAVQASQCAQTIQPCLVRKAPLEEAIIHERGSPDSKLEHPTSAATQIDAFVCELNSLESKEIITEPTVIDLPSDPNEAAERSRYLVDREIQELEDARRRKHDEAARQASSRPDAKSFLEEVKATLVGQPSTYKTVLERLLECFGTADTSAINELKEQIRKVLTGYPNLQHSLDNFIANEILFHSSSLPGPASKVMASFSQQVTTAFQNSIRPPISQYSAAFLSDNNVPDGHVFPTGAEFVKSWRIRNDGPAWENVELVFVAGSRLGTSAAVPNFYPVKPIASGEEVDIVLTDLKAPEEAGRYISHWRLRDANMNFFGPAMWCDIISADLKSDVSHHNSLANSAVVMPEIPPVRERLNDTTAATTVSTPGTVPTSALSSDDNSDVSSVPSGSVIDHSDEEWDDLQDVPALSSRRTANKDEYQVVYDSEDEL
ncbi:hypothetical protein Clacol_007458 [Clathrus columnatus]|uniref:ZZ-type domain-containing protein n=1 Tax=Clathrus columnatus TaxID=1419009 RepID=A0AAV5AHJ3_9AGAM|nr:hypothetical protein Clacol_007458 [Clathrus columnatus]